MVGVEFRVKLPKWLPDLPAFLNAGLLLVFGTAVSMVWALVVPFLFEIAEDHPRLFWSGLCALWLAPIPVGALVHGVAHRTLESLDKQKLRTMGNLWAGLFAWSAITFVTMTTSFVMCVIDPPPIDSGSFLHLAMSVSTASMSVRTAIWLIVAAFVSHVERTSRS